MNRQADVNSIDSIRQFRIALQDYSETVQDVVATLQCELQRAVDWFEQDRMSFWPAEVRRSNDKLVEARNQLEMKQLAVDPSSAPSCYDEKKAVERAKRRLRYAEERVQKTRHWLRIVKHEADEFKGLLANLGHISESDLPRAAAALERMTQALDRYAKSTTADPAPTEPRETKDPT
jgi:hypothetical protein